MIFRAAMPVGQLRQQRICCDGLSAALIRLAYTGPAIPGEAWYAIGRNAFRLDRMPKELPGGIR